MESVLNAPIWKFCNEETIDPEGIIGDGRDTILIVLNMEEDDKMLIGNGKTSSLGAMENLVTTDTVFMVSIVSKELKIPNLAEILLDETYGYIEDIDYEYYLCDNDNNVENILFLTGAGLSRIFVAMMHLEQVGSWIINLCKDSSWNDVHAGQFILSDLFDCDEKKRRRKVFKMKDRKLRTLKKKMESEEYLHRSKMEYLQSQYLQLQLEQ